MKTVKQEKIRCREYKDGGKAVEPHVVVGWKKIFVGPQTVLRWPD